MYKSMIVDQITGEKHEYENAKITLLFSYNEDDELAVHRWVSAPPHEILAVIDCVREQMDDLASSLKKEIGFKQFAAAKLVASLSSVEENKAQ